MLENVLEIGERPEDLVVYAARGKAARDWESYEKIVDCLTAAGGERDAHRPVGKAHRSIPEPAAGTSGAHGLREHCRPLRHPGVLQRAL